MAVITTMNRKVACTPFETKEVETRTHNAFTTVSQKTALTKLKVVYDYVDTTVTIKAGAHVWLAGDIAKDGRFSYVHEVEPGKQFVLLPLDCISIVEDLVNA